MEQYIPKQDLQFLQQESQGTFHIKYPTFEDLLKVDHLQTSLYNSSKQVFVI